MLHLRASDIRVMPWKDGGGSTAQVAIEPAGAALTDPFLWRVSSARVETSGPFSTFPGRQRILALLEGAGFILDLEGAGRLRLKNPRQPIAFSGDPAAHATLIQGPCLDLGLIYDPARVTGKVEVLTLGPDATSVTLATTTLIYSPSAPVGVDPVGVALAAGEALRFDGEAGTKVGLRAPEGGATVAVVHLDPA
ncbi:MAG TPA: HutD family protein [Holophagaceae bacterium]|nr:HutD family protein [Holophagaceae bacterium]